MVQINFTDTFGNISIFVNYGMKLMLRLQFEVFILPRCRRSVPDVWAWSIHLAMVL